MVDVFISYSRTNRELVERLAEAVQAEGYGVWWDEELPPHLSYGDVITEKIGSAKAAIVVWSRAAAASEWVRAEADVARNQKKLIQVAVDDAMPPLPFNQIQFASLADWQGEPDHPGWRKVKASLKALCGEREGAEGHTGVTAAPAASARRIAPSPVRPQPPAAARKGGIGLAGWIVAGGLALILIVVAVASLGPRLVRPTPAPVQQAKAPQPVPQAGAPTPGVTPQQVLAPRPGRFALEAVIEDPDGYTNLRSRPSTDAPIVARVDAGEMFTTFRQPGLWWQVRTADGTIGYMHRSRIRPAAGRR